MPFFILKIRFIFNSKLTLTCKYCHNSSVYLYQFNMVHDSTDKLEKELNKNKWEKRLCLN